MCDQAKMKKSLKRIMQLPDETQVLALAALAIILAPVLIPRYGRCRCSLAT